MKPSHWTSLLLFSALGAFLFYRYVPILWQIDYVWHIHASEPLEHERVQGYHQKWLDRIKDKNIHRFVKEKKCDLAQPLWNCAYIASNYRDFRKLRFEALHGYKKISGWVEPIELKQKLQALKNQKDDLDKTYQQSDQTIADLRTSMAAQQDKIETWAYEKNLLSHNLELREKQSDLYKQLLPQMSTSSTLYNMYIDQSFESKKKIRTIQKRIDKLNGLFEKNAPAWLEMENLMDKRDTWIQDQKNIDGDMAIYELALSKNKFGKVPHPLKYAFFLESENSKPVLQPKVFFPALLSLFLVFSNAWLAIRKTS